MLDMYDTVYLANIKKLTIQRKKIYLWNEEVKLPKRFESYRMLGKDHEYQRNTYETMIKLTLMKPMLHRIDK
jgi:hypothetical protein